MSTEASPSGTGNGSWNGYCWASFQDGRARCTRDPGHKGDHEDYYKPARWPNRGPEPQ
ncbi:hypothetical protein ACWGI8_30550 [Streptomyces sp. NPDC054841]